MTPKGTRKRPKLPVAPACVSIGLAIMGLLPPAFSTGHFDDGPPAGDGPLVFDAEDIGGVDVRTGTLLLSGQEGGNADGALLWALGEPKDDGLVEVSLVIEVDGAPLVDGLEGRRIAIAFLVYVVDDEGRLSGHLAQGIVLDEETHHEMLAAAGLKFFGSVKLPPGDYNFRVMVRETSTENFFLTRTWISVPALEAESPALPPLLFPDRSRDWIVVRQEGVAASLPIEDHLSFVPAARPVLAEGEDARFFLARGAPLHGESLEFDVLDSADRLVAEYPVEIPEAPSDHARLSGATLPGMDLPPGRYTLVLSTPADESGDGSTRTTEVLLVSPGEPRMWVGRSRMKSTGGGDESAGRREGKFRRRQAQSAYLDALRDLASGDETAARNRLGKLERHAAARDVLRSLRRIEDSVSAELEERNPRSLLPVALIHHQMVRRYVAHREFVLAARSRAVTADLAIRIGNSGAAPGFAEALLVSLASDLSRSANASLAKSYLESALLLDPNYRPALLALGASLERTAKYEDAVRVFRQLVESDSNDDEGRLRLAINLVRIGHERAAARLFRQLVGSHPVDWIAILAAQEFARLMIVNNSPDTALELLDRSIPRYPDDQRLRLLRAWLLESTNRSLDSVAALLQIPAAEDRASARLRYGEWPDLGLEVSATAIRETASHATRDLASALGMEEISS